MNRPILTADTITDEQIVELRNATIIEARDLTGARRVITQGITQTCADALTGGRGYSRAKRRKARARCAEILNARAAQGKS